IEWGFENDIREKSFITYECVGEQRHEVHFNASGIPKFSAFIKKVILSQSKLKKKLRKIQK
ncbi:hypothetical protein, partial [Mammaliicoccus sp. M-M49]|uniref:hypothetical protein n=1 Tax=Mammaliicoccus sp. M-M49 TaxID=2898708 RepID=UPI001EFA7441